MRSTVKPVLFAAIFMLLALALWNPLLPLENTRAELILLLDDSASMESSISDVDWASIRELISSLPDGSRFSLLRFAANSALEIPPMIVDDQFRQRIATLQRPPRQLNIDRNQSNLAAALQQALRLQPGADRPMILIVSDGGETQGDSSELLHQARQAQINVYGLLPHANESSNDIAIDNVSVPALARNNDRIPITIQLSTTHQASASLSIALNNKITVVDKLTLSPETVSTQQYWLQLQQPGLNQLEIKIESALDAIPQNNHYQTLINNEGAMPIIYVTTATDTPEFATRIKDSALPLALIQPSQLQQQLDSDTSIATVILDNISYLDISEQGWQRLEEVIRNNGTGLLVLGGPRTFADGAYRHSRLEALLPVIAEARQPQENIAVMFLVDKSGSMSRDADNINRLAYARKAVIETTRALTPDDLVGLIAFDAKSQEVLKLGKHELNIPAVEEHWQFRASGGTKLSPALALGIERLTNVEAKKRLLVLVTDGFVGDNNLNQIEMQLTEHKIDLVALAVGSDIDTQTLQRLAGINDGQFVHVNQQAQLPRVMRQQVEQVITSAHQEKSATHSHTAVPFMPVQTSWPPVHGYMVTRARDAATLFLQSDAGHPLFAAHNVGAARVAALPAGFQQWSDNWLTWPLWGEFAGGLLQWLSINYSTPQIHFDIIGYPDRIELLLDTVNDNSDWSNNVATTLQLTDPNHNTTQQTLTAIAPGRYSAMIPTPKAGHYHFNINVAGKVIQRDYLRNNNWEFSTLITGRQRFSQWQQQGLIKHWTSIEDAITANTTVQHIDSRPYFLIAAIMFYLGLMFYDYKRQKNH